MQEVLNLLKEKNTCLKRFVEINEKQMGAIRDGNFEELDDFYAARENILNMVKRIDGMVEMATMASKDGVQDPEIHALVHRSIQEKKNLVNRILAQDLEILSAIDTAKTQIIKELSAIQAGRKAISAYKSGEKEQNLDEQF